MKVFKGIFDEIKNELNSELEKAKRNSNSSEKANIEKIQKMFLGKTVSNPKHHRDSQEITRAQSKHEIYKAKSENQKKINDLKNKNYQKNKEKAYDDKKRIFNQTFESKHENSKSFSDTIKNHQSRISKNINNTSIHSNDLTKNELNINKIVKIDSDSSRNISNIGKKIINPENAKNAFIASIIFERKTWK